MTDKLSILVVEDNPSFRIAAAEYLSDKADVSFAVNYAGGIASALLYIVERDEKWRNLRQFDGAMIDCFFPPSAEGVNHTEFGERAIEKMIAVDETGQYIERFAQEMGKYVDLTHPGLLKAVRSYAWHDRESGIENLNPIGEIFKSLEIVNTRLGRDEATNRLNQLLTITFPWYSENDPKVKDYFGALRESMQKDPSNQPLGILVAESLEQRKIPFVLATSTYHHDMLTQPIQNYCHEKGWTLIDCPQNNPNEKAQASFWNRAYENLLREIGGRK